MSAHHCHARGCRRECPPRHLMCHRHWRMVPERLQARVWATYRAGQEIDKRPSRAWLEAAETAIEAVAELEAAARRRDELARRQIGLDFGRGR